MLPIGPFSAPQTRPQPLQGTPGLLNKALGSPGSGMMGPQRPQVDPGMMGMPGMRPMPQQPPMLGMPNGVSPVGPGLPMRRPMGPPSMGGY